MTPKFVPAHYNLTYHHFYCFDLVLHWYASKRSAERIKESRSLLARLLGSLGKLQCVLLLPFSSCSFSPLHLCYNIPHLSPPSCIPPSSILHSPPSTTSDIIIPNSDWSTVRRTIPPSQHLSPSNQSRISSRPRCGQTASILVCYSLFKMSISIIRFTCTLLSNARSLPDSAHYLASSPCPPPHFISSIDCLLEHSFESSFGNSYTWFHFTRHLFWVACLQTAIDLWHINPHPFHPFYISPHNNLAPSSPTTTTHSTLIKLQSSHWHQISPVQRSCTVTVSSYREIVR